MYTDSSSKTNSGSRRRSKSDKGRPGVGGNSLFRTHFGVTMNLVSLKTAAIDQQVSARTIRRRAADGDITLYRLGRLIRVDLDEVRGAWKPVNKNSAKS
jgi:excisionase family DNA binding protein